MQQLDIFDDSRDVSLRNDLAQALLDGDNVAAQHIAHTLQAEFGADAVLAPAAVLIDHLRMQGAQAEQTHGQPCSAGRGHHLVPGTSGSPTARACRRCPPR